MPRKRIRIDDGDLHISIEHDDPDGEAREPRIGGRSVHRHLLGRVLPTAALLLAGALLQSAHLPLDPFGSPAPEATSTPQSVTGRYGPDQALMQPGAISGGSVTTWYVSPAGNDSNNCLSTGTACLTLLHTSGLTSAGDTIQMAAGTYPAQTITAAGTSLLPVTVMAAPGAAVILSRPASPSDPVQTTPLLALTNSAWVTVQGITVTGMVGRGDITTADKPTPAEVTVTSSGLGAGVVISDVVVQNANGTCLSGASQPITVTASLFSVCGHDTADGAIAVAGDSVLVASNEITASTGFGIKATGASVLSPSAANVITGNFLMNGGAATAIQETGDNAKIALNVLSWNNGTAIEVAGNNNTVYWNGCSYDNFVAPTLAFLRVDSGSGNAIYNNSDKTCNIHGNQITVGATGPTTGTIIENNILDSNNNSTTEVVTTSFAYSTTADYNVYTYHLNMSSVVDSQNNSLMGPHTLFTGPSYAFNPGTSGIHRGNLHQTVFSSVAGLGTNVGLPYAGSEPDIGAYCYTSCPPGWGRTFYVSTTGSDTNDCTIWRPCAGTAIASLQSGTADTILMESGTYVAPATIISTTPFLGLNAEGSPQANDVLSGQDAVTVTFPVVLTTDNQAIHLLSTTHSYLAINHVTFVGPKGRVGALADPWTGQGMRADNGDMVLLGGQSEAVTDSVFLNPDATCLGLNNTTTSARPSSLYSSTFINCGEDTSAPNASLVHGVYATGGPADIAGNYFNGSSGYGIHCHLALGGCNIRYNIAVGANAFGIIADQAGSTVDHNIVFGNRQGISTNSGVTITNNLIVDNDPMGNIPGGLVANVINGAPNIIVANTIYNNGGTPECCDIWVTAGQPITFENNLLGGGPNNAGVSGHTPFRAIGGIANWTVGPLDYNAFPQVSSVLSAEGAHNKRVDPVFVTPLTVTVPVPDPSIYMGSGSDYSNPSLLTLPHLDAGSSLIHAGVTVPITDPSYLISDGTAYDIGASCYGCLNHGLQSLAAGSTMMPFAFTFTPQLFATPTTTPTAQPTLTPTPTNTATPTITPTPFPTPLPGGAGTGGAGGAGGAHHTGHRR